MSSTSTTPTALLHVPTLIGAERRTGNPHGHKSEMGMHREFTILFTFLFSATREDALQCVRSIGESP